MMKLIETIRRPLSAVDMHERHSMARRVETLSWGRPIWALIAEVYNVLMDPLLDSDKRSDNRQLIRYRARAMRSRERANAGRPLTYAMKAQIHRIRAEGISNLLVRDAVIGRVLRQDGSIDLRPWRRYVLLGLGALWHLVAIAIGTLLLLIAVLLPGPLLTKIVAAAVIVAYSLFAMGFVNAITIRAALSFPAFEKQWRTGRPSEGTNLRVIS
jgi:hypothetical protein